MPTTPVADHLLPFELEYHPPCDRRLVCRGCTSESPRWGTCTARIFFAGHECIPGSADPISENFGDRRWFPIDFLPKNYKGNAADIGAPPSFKLDLPYRLCGTAAQQEVKEKLMAAIYVKMPRTSDGKIKMTDRARLEEIVRDTLLDISIESEVSRLKALTNISHTKPDLHELASLIAVRPAYRFYGLRAVPISAVEYIGLDAMRSAIWLDGKPTEERERGAAAISIPPIAECSVGTWERAFNRSFNLLRQYALTHCDDSPLRMYKFLVLGSNEAEPLDEDFEISMIGAKVLAACRLACVAPESDKPRRACALPEPPRVHLARQVVEEAYRTPLMNLAEVREAFADNIPDEFRSAAALMATEIGDPDKLW